MASQYFEQSYPTPPLSSSPQLSEKAQYLPASSLPRSEPFVPTSQYIYPPSNAINDYETSGTRPAPSPSPNSPYRASSRSNSPLHRFGNTLSPYNASRPRPRAGYVKRIKNKLSGFLRWITETGKKHPLLMGAATFVPVMGAVLVAKMFKGMRGLLGKGKGFGGSKSVGKGSMAFGVFDDFKGLAGAKSELHGLLKIVHMFANHWCKLSPSALPRTVSILLELFFMEAKKL